MIGVAILWLLVGIVLGAAGGLKLIVLGISHVPSKLRLKMIQHLTAEEVRANGGPDDWMNCEEHDCDVCPVCHWHPPADGPELPPEPPAG